MTLGPFIPKGEFLVLQHILRYPEAQLGKDTLQDIGDSKSEDSSETGRKREQGDPKSRETVLTFSIQTFNEALRFLWEMALEAIKIIVESTKLVLRKAY